MIRRLLRRERRKAPKAGSFRQLASFHVFGDGLLDPLLVRPIQTMKTLTDGRAPGDQAVLESPSRRPMGSGHPETTGPSAYDPPEQIEVRPRSEVGVPLRIFLAFGEPHGVDALISVLVGHAGIT